MRKELCVGDQTVAPLDASKRTWQPNGADDGFEQGVLATNESALGSVFVGRETLRAAWADYFRLVSEYRITIDELADGEASLLLVGSVAGRSAGVEWTVPAAWRAVVEDGRLAEWQVYVDNEPLRASLRFPDPPPAA